MDYKLILIFIALFIPMTYILKTIYFNRYVLTGKMKDKIDTYVKQALQESKMDKEWVISDYTDFKVSEDRKIHIKVFLTKTGDSRHRNPIQVLYMITGKILDENTFVFESLKEYGSEYSDKELEIENTSHLDTLSLGLPSVIRNFFQKPVENIDTVMGDFYSKCGLGGLSSYFCKDSGVKYRTNEKIKVIPHSIKNSYGHFTQEEVLEKPEDPLECESMFPYESSRVFSNEEEMLVCKLREDYDYVSNNIATLENHEPRDEDFF